MDLVDYLQEGQLSLNPLRMILKILSDTLSSKSNTINWVKFALSLMHLSTPVRIH